MSTICKRSMDMAWTFVKANGFTMKEALETAWMNIKLRKAMKDRVVRFRFRKVDGSIREAYGTLQESMLPPLQGSDRPKDERLQVYYDTEKQSYRCFKKNALLAVEL